MSESREAEIRKTWFPDHVADLQRANFGTGGTVERIIWKHRNGGSIYWVQYLLHGCGLFVSGDIGEAVFTFGRPVSPEWLAGLDLGYFARKCMASDCGRQFTEWCPDQAKRRATELWNEIVVERREAGQDERRSFISFAESEGDWHEFLRTDEAVELLGEVWEYASIGKRVSIQCEGMLVGLKMAVEQLRSADPQVFKTGESNGD